jgi:hypothetical protein
MLRLLVAALIAVSATKSTLALDEVMRDGVKKYLTYAQAQTDNPRAPSVPVAPVEPSDGVKKTEPATEQTKKSFWTHNRSRMYMTEAGTRRQIYYEDPRARHSVGADSESASWRTSIEVDRRDVSARRSLDRKINRGLEVLAVRWGEALPLLGFLACSLQHATSRSVGPPPFSLTG